jgi:hypothetical protein
MILSHEIKAAIKEVLSTENIAFVEDYTYRRLWNAVTFDPAVQRGQYTNETIKLLIRAELYSQQLLTTHKP